MIIVALIGAAAFYVALYCLWAASSQHLVGVAAWMHVFNDMLFMPGNLVFTLLRGLILITALYVFADSLKAGVHKFKRRRVEAKRAREEPFAVVAKYRPPQP
ncbi:hypothetical protein EON80_30865 [bacterium]|nr:MAG: hypothetical protein EON80_30865 [bacterium]